MEQYILKQLWKDLVLVGDLEMEFDGFKELFKQYEPIENETKMVRVASDDDLDEVYYEEEPVDDDTNPFEDMELSDAVDRDIEDRRG